MCGVFYGMGEQLTPQEYKRCIARSALALAPADENGNKLLWMFMVIAENIAVTRMPALDVTRRFKVLKACDIIADIIYEPDDQ